MAKGINHKNEFTGIWINISGGNYSPDQGERLIEIPRKLGVATHLVSTIVIACSVIWSSNRN
jgi:hypothetical protein